MAIDDGWYGATALTSNRIGKIISQAIWILDKYADGRIKGVMRNLPSALLYDIVQRGQEMLAEETLCIEKSATLAFSSGSAAEPTGFYRMEYLVLPSSVANQAIEIDRQEQDRLSRLLTAQDTAGGNAVPADQYLYRRAGTIYSWASLTDGDYTLYYWGRPTTTVASDTNPETPAYMDTCLLYYLVKEAAHIVESDKTMALYEQKFQMEFERIQSAHSRTQTVQRTIKVHDLE